MWRGWGWGSSSSPSARWVFCLFVLFAYCSGIPLRQVGCLVGLCVCVMSHSARWVFLWLSCVLVIMFQCRMLGAATHPPLPGGWVSGLCVLACCPSIRHLGCPICLLALRPTLPGGCFIVGCLHHVSVPDALDSHRSHCARWFFFIVVGVV